MDKMSKKSFTGTSHKRVEIHLMVWPGIPQVEIYTDRGESFVAEGNKAVEFAEWLRTNLCDPILIKPGSIHGGQL